LLERGNRSPAVGRRRAARRLRSRCSPRPHRGVRGAPWLEGVDCFAAGRALAVLPPRARLGAPGRRARRACVLDRERLAELGGGSPGADARRPVAPSALVALAGIALAGAGCSVCGPTIISIAGRAVAPHERATVVGSVTTIMYLGFLVGPAVVGGLAELTTLRTSLGSVAALGLLLMFLFVFVRLPGRSSG